MSDRNRATAELWADVFVRISDVRLPPSRMAAESTETGETVWQHPFEEHRDLQKQANPEDPAESSTGQGGGEEGRAALAGAKRPSSEGELGDQRSRQQEEASDRPEGMPDAGTALRKRKHALRD